MAEDFISNHVGYVLLRVKVAPNARGNMIDKLHDGRLKIKIAAAPENGKANKAITKFLAEKLGVGICDVEIVAGHIIREKTVKISGVDFDEVMLRLNLQPTLPLF